MSGFLLFPPYAHNVQFYPKNRTLFGVGPLTYRIGRTYLTSTTFGLRHKNPIAKIGN